MLCVTLSLNIFTKLKAKLSLFCTSPISRACPVWLAPKVTKNLSQNILFHFHFFLQIQSKLKPDFWLRWLFPPNRLVLFICFEKKGRVLTTLQDKIKNKSQGASGRRSVLIIVAPSSLAFDKYDWYYMYISSLTWKYIFSLSLTEPKLPESCDFLQNELVSTDFFENNKSYVYCCMVPPSVGSTLLVFSIYQRIS